MKSVKKLDSVKNQVAQLNGKTVIGGASATEYGVLIATFKFN